MGFRQKELRRLKYAVGLIAAICFAYGIWMIPRNGLQSRAPAIAFFTLGLVFFVLFVAGGWTQPRR
jgi:hypothetical protein